LTWLVKITPSREAVDAGAKETITVIQSDDCEDLFKWKYEWKWETVLKLMEQGLIRRVDIDYVPGGVRAATA
jgi:hypothetical protein